MVQRTFIPGSNWIYIKLYTGEKTADDILIKVFDPVLRKIKDRQLLKKWFFIRYADPDFHLRIRLLIDENQYFGEMMFLLNHKLHTWIINHSVWKVQLDTYNRELERYHHNLIEEAESIFCYDSECILDILKKINGNEDYRWMITLKLIDELLSDFCYKLEEKQCIMEEISLSFKSEFEFKDLYLKQFSVMFRKNKKIIESVLDDTFNEKEFISLCHSIKKRTIKLQPIAEQIKYKLKNEAEINRLMKSYLHMMINRIFPVKNRIHEMIVSDFMNRYYTSEIVKNKRDKEI